MKEGGGVYYIKTGWSCGRVDGASLSGSIDKSIGNIWLGYKRKNELNQLRRV